MSHLSSSLDAGLLVLTLDRPQVRNALTFELVEALEAALEQAAADARVEAVVVTGGGGHFCAGLDPGVQKALLELPGGAEELRRVQREVQQVFSTLERLEKPTVAAIEGACLGAGLELALCCDLRVASSDASFSLPQTRLGLVPDLGGTARLTRLCGPAVAREWVFTGRTYPTVRALELSLVNELVVPGDAVLRAKDLAREVLQGSPRALRWAKQLIASAQEVSLEESLQLERLAVSDLLASGQPQEGVEAALAGRPPGFIARKP